MLKPQTPGDSHSDSRRDTSSSRRVFLTGVAALGVSVLIPQGVNLAQTSAKKRPRRIDVHHHPSLPGAPPAVRTTQTGPPPARWTPETALKMMDDGGVDLTVLSGGGGDAKNCRIFNDYMAKLVSDYPGRFGMFTTLPFPDIDGCLKEIEYGLDTLKADGVHFGTSYNGKWLGDPAFEPLFEELNRRKAVVYTHPGAPQCCAKLVPGIADSSIEFGTDTTRAIVKMIYSGCSAKYSDMKVIFSHAGGTMPYLVVRLTKDATMIKDTFRDEAGRFYYDTAQTAGYASMAALKGVVPMSHIVFGTDYPFITAANTAKGLKESGVFNAKELAQIDAGNALAALFPKYAV